MNAREPFLFMYFFCKILLSSIVTVSVELNEEFRTLLEPLFIKDHYSECQSLDCATKPYMSRCRDFSMTILNLSSWFL